MFFNAYGKWIVTEATEDCTDSASTGDKKLTEPEVRQRYNSFGRSGKGNGEVAEKGRRNQNEMAERNISKTEMRK